jgi:hypothetical protein
VLALGGSLGAALLTPTAAPGAGRLLLALLLGRALLLLATLALGLLMLALSALLLLFLLVALASLLANALAPVTPALELRRGRFLGGRDRGLWRLRRGCGGGRHRLRRAGGSRRPGVWSRGLRGTRRRPLMVTLLLVAATATEPEETHAGIVA